MPKSFHNDSLYLFTADEHVVLTLSPHNGIGIITRDLFQNSEAVFGNACQQNDAVVQTKLTAEQLVPLIKLGPELAGILTAPIGRLQALNNTKNESLFHKSEHEESVIARLWRAPWVANSVSFFKNGYLLDDWKQALKSVNRENAGFKPALPPLYVKILSDDVSEGILTNVLKAAAQIGLPKPPPSQPEITTSLLKWYAGIPTPQFS